MRKNKFYSLVVAMCMIINILAPSLAFANEQTRQSNNITVSVERRVLGKEDIISQAEVQLTDNQPEKASYVLDRVLSESGIAYENKGSLDSNFYLSWLDTKDGSGGLAEFDHGQMSGWKYSVNGIFPSVGFSDYTLQPGDKVRVCYTAKDMGNDILLVDKIDSLKEISQYSKSLNENEYTTDSFSSLKEAIKVSDEKIAKYENIGPMLSSKLGSGDLDTGKAISEDIDPSIDSLQQAIDGLEKETNIPEEVPTPEYQLHLKRTWTDFDKIYLREDQDSICVSLKWVDSEEAKLNDAKVKPIDPNKNPFGDDYVAVLKKGINKITIIDWVEGVKKPVDRYIYVEEMNYSIEGNVSPGETITLKLEGLEAQLTDNKTHPLKESQTTYSTDIPGLRNIKSDKVLGENPDAQKLSNITFTIPKDTEIGEYKLINGNMYHKFGGVSINAGFSNEFSRLPEIILNVTDKNEEVNQDNIYDIDLSKWTEFDTVYTTEDKAYIRVNKEVKEINIGSNTINVDGKNYEINCKKVSYEVQNASKIVPGSKVTIKFKGLEEAFKYIPGVYNPYKIKTRYSSDIKGLEDVDAISSATAGGMGGADVDREILNTVEFTLPDNTKPGEYNLNKGRIYQGWYGSSINGSMENDFSKLPNIKINVKEGSPEDTTSPTIETSLKDNTTVTSSDLSFTAYVSDDKDAMPKLTVKLDGEVVTTNRPGRYQVKLLEGNNLITLEGTDKSGNTTRKNYNIICEPVLKEGDSIILDKEHLRLQVGETHNIIAVDSPDKRSNEKDEVARMTYEVTQGKDVVKVNKVGKIEALKIGNAKISVKYPGLKQPGIVTVNVVKDKNSDDPKIITDIKETKYDTFYYTNNNSSYSFEVSSPNADNVEVKVNDVVVNENKGKYNVNLKPGNNTIEIKATSGSKVNEKYYNIKAKLLDINIKNITNEGNEIVQGDKVRIEFKGLEIPVPKFLRVYNPKNTRVEYKTNIPGMENIYGQGSQYDIASKNAIEFTATKAGTFKFTEGVIDEAWWGDPLFSERDIYDEGPNLNASVRKDKFSSLPQFSITVKENTEFESKYSAEVENKDNIKPGSEVVIKIPQIEMPDTGTCEINEAKTIFNTNIPQLEEIQSQEAKDNHENLKEIRFTLPENLKPGTYTITNGRVFKEWLPNTSSLYKEGEFYKGELPQIKIEVKENSITTQTSVQNSVAYYKQINKSLRWWEMLALTSANEDINSSDYNLPTWSSNVINEKTSLTDDAGYLLGIVSRGQNPNNYGEDNKNLSKIVTSKQNEDGSFPGGVNSQIWAMISLEVVDGEYDREKALDYLISKQLNDGGFAFFGSKADPDMTGMALIALSFFAEEPKGQEAISKAVDCLNSLQKEDGTFEAYGKANSNSIAMAMTGLNSVGQNLNGDNWRNIVKALMKFQIQEGQNKGAYKYLMTDSSSNSMATEQSLIAMGEANFNQNLWKVLDDKFDGTKDKPGVNEAPIINASNLELKLNEEFNPLNGVSASDKEDGDLTKNIKVIENTVDTSKEGLYKVVYEVEDSKGLKTTKEINVSVVKDNIILPPVNVSNGIESASKWILENNKNPGFEDEWKILGLARSEVKVPGTYFKTYYSNLEEKVIDKKGELSRNKYTEYSRVIIALTSLGYDPTNIGGYNLVEKLYDFNNVSKQGINGVIFALIALDTKNYEIEGDSNSREKMINYIVDRQLEDGGFALSGNKGEIDITAMALQALAKYQDKENVKLAINKAVNFLSQNQLETGGYGAKGSLIKEIIKTITNKNTVEENLESSAQVLVAINALGMDATNEKFVKNDNTIVDAMMNFKAEDGGFKHLLNNSSSNSMATEQALYAFASQNRLSSGKTSLYDMSDVEDIKPEIPDNNQKPVINATDKFINVGDKFDPMDGVSATDKEDGDLTKDIKIIENTVDTKVAGEYKVVYEVSDSKGLKETKAIIVVVKEIQQPTNKKLKVGVYTDEKAIVESIEVEYKEGDTAYTVLKRILGDKVVSRGENETLYVEGIDDLYEFDKGAQSGWVYAVNRVKPNVSSGIYKLNPGDEMIWHYTLDLGEDITNSYEKFDKFLSGEGEVLPPAKNEAPVIKASNLDLYVGDKFEPLNGISASDKEDGDLTKDIKVIENTVDTSKEGIYKVVYEVEDSQGLKTTKEIKVSVTKKIEKVDVSQLINSASSWILSNTKEAKFGDEWKVLGLSRGNIKVPDNYYETYYNNVAKEVKDKKGELSRNKYTEYSRLIIALTSLGYDPTNVGGYNLVEKLYDMDKVSKQGINGVIFALIALDTKDYEIKGDLNSRDKMINYILENQLSDGGFALSGDKGEVDITAMAIQSLAKYKRDEKVNKAIEKALTFLSNKQSNTGGFATEEGENLESSAQVLVALNQLGISAKEERFMKDGKTIVDAMARFEASDRGFKHVLNEGSANSMATEQALYAFVSQMRLNDGKTSLYDMSDLNGGGTNPPINPDGGTNPDLEDPNPPTNPGGGSNGGGNGNGNGGGTSPSTSDTSSIILYTAVLAMSLVGVVVLNKKKKIK